MKRTMRMVLCLALVMMLVLPATAFARGKANAPGQVKKAAGDQAVVADEVPDADVDEPAGDTGKPAKADKDKAKGKSGADGDADVASGEPGRAAKRARETSGSVETSGTTERKRVGIENAMSRIQRNIERAESRIEAGTSGRIPPGLLSVLEKFMGWLGLASVPVDESGPGTELDPVEETTSTVEPTATVEPTGTPEPEL